MDPAPTQYLDREGSALAYQVFGTGPTNLIGFLEIVQHLDLCWTDPHIHHNFERISRLGHAIAFQRRGVGLSEPVAYVPTLEQQAEDVLAVMDANGMDRAILHGTHTTCAPLVMVAACMPERVAALVLYGPSAAGYPLEGHVPSGWPPAEAAAYARDLGAALDQWGTGLVAPLWNANSDTPYNRRLMAMLERSSATPAAARAHYTWASRLDITDVLRSVSVPTHVLRLASERLPEAAVRQVAELIPGATYHCLPGLTEGASLGEAYSYVIDFIEQHITGVDRRAVTDRALGTLLFTDIVGSTELLARLGDFGYREVRAAHERQVHLAVETAGGRLVNVAGDGTLSVFDGPARAVRCADTIRREAAALGLTVRAGVHTGELERIGPDVSGLTVHIAARVSAAARPGEILVSRTVRDIAVGSGLGFADRGAFELKGLPEKWRLFAVESVDQPRPAVALEPSMQTFADRAALVTARRAPGAMRALMRVGNSIQRRRGQRGAAVS